MNSFEFSFLYLYQFKFSFYTPCGFAHSKFTRHFCTRSYFVIKHSYVIIKFWQWWILIIYKRLKNVRKYRTALVHMCMNCFDDIWWMNIAVVLMKQNEVKRRVKVKVDEVVKVKITFFFTKGLLFVSAQKTLFMYVHLNKIKCIHSNWHISNWPIFTHHHN